METEQYRKIAKDQDNSKGCKMVVHSVGTLFIPENDVFKLLMNFNEDEIGAMQKAITNVNDVSEKIGNDIAMSMVELRNHDYLIIQNINDTKKGVYFLYSERYCIQRFGRMPKIELVEI